jgi:low affinity Fe/Cu permease
MLPILALAHVKWFVDTSDVISSQHGKIPFYYLTSIEVLVWSVISIIVVVLFSIFDRIIPEPKALLRFSENTLLLSRKQLLQF